MPLQSDPTRPVRTYNSDGRVISTESAIPIKNVDSVGREVQKDAQSVAEQAADQAGIKVSPEIEEKPKDEAKEEKITEKDVRKEYLEAQRIKRKAIEMEKKAETNLKRAEAFDKARSLAESGEDPTAILKAANLDPVKFFQEMTKYAISDKGKKEETDPVKRELKEHQERLDKYAKDLEVQAKTIKEKEELAAHNEVISTKVVPILQNNPEKYETLLLEYGNNAAVEVYKTVWDIYQQTGKARSFEEVADEMESYWQNKVEEGINNALKLRKFRDRFGAQSGQGASDDKSKEQYEIPKRSQTLSNKHSASPLINKTSKNRVLTKDERVAEILKKFPDVR
jgi:hypothetical protein